MSSVLSSAGHPSFLSVGLAVGVGVGAVISTMRRKVPEPANTSDVFEKLRAERDVLAAKLEEAQLRVEALEEKRKDLGRELSQEAQKTVKVGEELEEARRLVGTLQQKVNASQKELALLKLDCESKVSSVTAMTTERDVLASRLKEAQLQIEAFEQKQKEQSSKSGKELEEMRGLVGTAEVEQDVLQKELARSKLECESKVSSMRQALSAVSAELDSTKAELAELCQAQENVATLQAELDALRTEFKECAAVAARGEVAQKQAKALELERGAMLQEVEIGMKARTELEDVRRRVRDLETERDEALEQHGEAIRQVRILEEEQKSLKTNVSAKKQKRKDSFRALSEGLSDISAQLDSAQTSWTPKKQIGNTQKRVESLWQDLAGEESEDDLLRGG